MDVDLVPVSFDDEPYRRHNAESIERSPNPTRDQQIELAIIYENAPDFVELINNLPSDVLDDKLILIWRHILYYDSGKCAAAILDGLTQITEIPVPTSKVSLLHQAADFIAPKVIAALLQRGFSADVRGDFGPVEFKNAPPLHLVMSYLCYCFSCDKDESSASLLAKICHQHLRKPLETLRLIALNTTEVKREFFNYLKEGKIIEVCALLLVAKSQILSPSTSKGDGEFRSIPEILDFVLNTIYTLNKSMVLREGNELYEMTKILELLKILDKIGDKLAALLRIDFTQTCLANSSMLIAETLIEDAGFNVDYFSDDSSYSRSEAESYFLKGAIDACEKTILTSDMLPVWVKEAALKGLGVKTEGGSRFTYRFLAKTLPHVKSVPVASPMKKTAPPYQGMLKRVFRHGKRLR